MSLVDFVKCGSHEAVKAALDRPGHTADELARALFEAVRRDDLALVNLLLNHGADPNQRFPDDWLMLHSAVEHQQVDMIRLLVARGADVNIPDETGWTPLHHAVDLEGDGAWQCGKVPTGDLPKLLAELGANPNAKTSTGRTPLDVARDYRHEAAIALLTR
jgi:ankyrin repeat protein